MSHFLGRTSLSRALSSLWPPQTPRPGLGAGWGPSWSSIKTQRAEVLFCFLAMKYFS